MLQAIKKFKPKTAIKTKPIKEVYKSYTQIKDHKAPIAQELSNIIRDLCPAEKEKFKEALKDKDDSIYYLIEAIEFVTEPIDNTKNNNEQ